MTDAVLLVVWLALAAALVLFGVSRRQATGGLTLGYFLSLSLIHVPGVLPYVVEGPELRFREATMLGFRVTLLGMAAYVVGAMVARRLEKRRTRRGPVPAADRAAIFDRFGWRAIGVGAFCYFVLTPILGRIPSMTAIFSQLGGLLVLGICMRLYSASLVNDRKRTFSALALVPVLPLSSLLANGIINYGTNWAIGVVSFLFGFSRRRRLYVIAAPFAIFLGLSFFVAYMGQRESIRESVWQQRAGLSERLIRASTIITEFKLLDLGRPLDRYVIAGRLNFNEQLGLGVKRHELGQVTLRHGSTIDPTALIPRALWPDKPFKAGGGTLVTEFSGIYYDPSKISVGAGQVLEFYMNFGILGVIAGFLGLGYIFGWMDWNIGRGFAEADLRRVLLYGLPGLNLLAPGGNLLETLVALVAAMVSARVLVSMPYFKPTKLSSPVSPEPTGQVRRSVG